MKRLLPVLFVMSVTVSTAGAAVRTNVVERSYDRFGRLVGLSVDGERRTEIAYDDATGRVASMCVAGEDEPFRWEYEPGSELKRTLRYPNGAKVTWEYEPHRDFVTLVSNDVYSSFRYAYDAAGRRVSKNDERYEYNKRGELTLATNAATDAEFAYRYDDIGNRKIGAEHKVLRVEYSANDLNQYTNITSCASQGASAFQPVFDADGNQTLVKTETGIWSVVYNAENRPILWTQGTDTVMMSYDRTGRRVTKGNHRFIYDGYLQIADSAGNAYVWDPTEPVAARPLSWRRGGATAYYTHDGNKNVSEVVADRGEAIAHYEYAPFGAISVRCGESAAENPWRFSSEYADDETATAYYNYRHYDSEHGRWFGRDPIGEKGGISLYAIGGNTLIAHIDLLGKYVSPLSEEEIKLCKTRLDKARSVALKQLNENNSCKCVFKNSTLCKEDSHYRLENIKIEIDNTSDVCLEESAYGYTYDNDRRWKIYVCPRACRWGYLCLAETLLHELFHECKPGVDDDDGSGETYDVERKCGLGDSCR